ncbi:MAG TPA: phage holin family protein [Polyangiaceae bacterium]|nr:phage holin family protein [Polyangiaceae bacterium]
MTSSSNRGGRGYHRKDPWQHPDDGYRAGVHLLVQWLILSLAFWLTAKVVPGFHVRSLGDAIVVAAVFGIVNFLLGTLLYVVLGVATLGIGFLLSLITHWIVNAILLKVTDGLTHRLEVRGFGTALIAALVMSVLGKLGIYAMNIAMHHSPAGSIYI